MRNIKNIREFKKGDMIYICGWLPVKEDAFSDKEGHTFLVVTIPIMRYAQLLKFDWREEYECKESEAA